MNKIFTVSFIVVSLFLLNFTVTMGEEAKPVYQAKDYSSLLGMPGFSNTMLQNHFKLYEGYAKNFDLLINKLENLLIEDKTGSPEYNEMERRLGWEFNGMRLHEYYFENLGGNGVLDEHSELYKHISEEFGSFELWKKDFISAGKMRGIGWAALYEDPRTGHLLNMWINEHDTGHMAGGNLLLIMDVFEHAYITDYQLDRAAYIDAFFKNIKWEEVSKRFQDK
jgi:Fe-Mn family superoxide dismutase